MQRVPLIDRLLLWLLDLARNLCALQGVAFGCAAAATLASTGVPESPWAARTLALGSLLSGTFVVAAILLWRMGGWRPQRDPGSDPADSRWPAALGGSLVLIAGLSLVASAGLPALWREISAHLSAIGFWEGVTTPSQFGGIIIVPVMLALLAPALVTAAAIFSFLLPLVLLARLPYRPLVFPTITAMGTVVQGALTVTGWLATALLRELSHVAAESMSSARDLEVRQLADQLTTAVSVLMTSATQLLAPTVLLVAWAAFLRPSGHAASQFGRGIVPGSEDLPNREGNRRAEPIVVLSGEAGGAPIASRLLPAGLAARLLIALGVLMLLFAGMEELRSRASFVSSTPGVGAQVAGTPAVIRVVFDRALDSASTLRLVYLPVEPSEGDISNDVPVTSRLAATDPDRRTLEAAPPRLDRGLYMVRWVAYPESGGVARHGSFAFGVGAAVPPDRSGMTLDERDSGDRGRRHTLLGGMLLLAIGAVAWHRASRLR